MNTHINFFIFLIVTMVPLGMFVFYRNILDHRSNDRIIYSITIPLFGMGVILVFVRNGFFDIFFAFPLICFQIYKIALASFVGNKHRAPIDTAYNFSSGLFYDRLFNIGFVTLGWLAPLFLMLFTADGLRDIKTNRAEHVEFMKKHPGKGDAFGIAKCTAIDKGVEEDFAIYEFFIDGKKISGATAIEKEYGEELLGNFFKVNYASTNPAESDLLTEFPVVDNARITKAGFKVRTMEPYK